MTQSVDTNMKMISELKTTLTTTQDQIVSLLDMEIQGSEKSASDGKEFAKLIDEVSAGSSLPLES